MTLKPGAKSSPKLSIDWLKSQAKNVQKEVLETLTALSESEAQALLWNWPFWARQDQLPPPGTWTSWHLGVAANKKKFANAVPVARDTVVTGLANPPEVIWSQTPLVVTPSDGTLTGGRLAIAVFTLHLPVPEAG